MKKIIAFLLLLPVTIFSQYTGVVTYIQDLNLISSEEYSGETNLFFNKQVSSYLYKSLPEEQKIKRDGMRFKVEVADEEGLPIYIDRTKKEVHHKITYGLHKSKCVVIDTLHQINWKMSNETKQISKYTCSKAIGEFGGRTYEAWFTTEIPVSSGPYKLWGLPGLILEAKSTDGMVSFFLKGLKITQEINEIKEPTAKDIYPSKEAFLIAKKEYDDKLMKKAKSLGINFSINKPHPDSKIEKSKT